MKRQLESLIETAIDLGATKARLIHTKSVVFDERSFLKCRFGCNRWGKYWTCPPYLDISYDQFKSAFNKYNRAIIVQTASPEDGQKISLEIEKQAMLNHQCSFAFALVLCVLCEECAHPEPCRHPDQARPSMDAYGIDIGKTIKPLGLKVEFNENGNLLPAWYSMVLLE